MHGSFNDKAGQLERDFGVPHPIAQLDGGLRRRDNRDIEPHTISVAVDRLAELDARGFPGDDGLVVLLMRGARIEVLARAIGHEVEVMRGRVRRGFSHDTLDRHIGESQRGLDLMRRA